MLIFLIACLLPLGETFFYKSSSYCFDDTTGMWWLNVLVYGSWQFAALLSIRSSTSNRARTSP